MHVFSCISLFTRKHKQVGNIGLGYSISSPTVYPSMAITGQDRALAGGALDVMNMDEAVVRAGTGAQTGAGHRWGDYASMHVDPTDECTFYFVHPYIETNGASSWRTFISSFRFPSCVDDPTASPPPGLTYDEDGDGDARVSALSMVSAMEVTGQPTPVTGQQI
jgi:hypothetical protein